MCEWENPEVVAAIIGAAGTIIAAVFASVAAWLLGRQIAQRQRLESKLKEAQGDLAFLLEVEARHCAANKLSGGRSNKIIVRKEVWDETGLAWSGKNTPGRV